VICEGHWEKNLPISDPSASNSKIYYMPASHPKIYDPPASHPKIYAPVQKFVIPIPEKIEKLCSNKHQVIHSQILLHAKHS